MSSGGSTPTRGQTSRAPRTRWTSAELTTAQMAPFGAGASSLRYPTSQGTAQATRAQDAARAGPSGCTRAAAAAATDTAGPSAPWPTRTSRGRSSSGSSGLPVQKLKDMKITRPAALAGDHWQQHGRPLRVGESEGPPTLRKPRLARAPARSVPTVTAAHRRFCAHTHGRKHRTHTAL